MLDREIRGDTNNAFGFVIRWTDASGVYVNVGVASTYSLAWWRLRLRWKIDTDGRVSPNWDLVEIDTVSGTTNDLWGADWPFYATTRRRRANAGRCDDQLLVAAFNAPNYDPAIEYHHRQREDAYTDGGSSWLAYGSWPSFTNPAAEPYYSAWCEDGPNTARNGHDQLPHPGSR